MSPPTTEKSMRQFLVQTLPDLEPRLELNHPISGEDRLLIHLLYFCLLPDTNYVAACTSIRQLDELRSSLKLITNVTENARIIGRRIAKTGIAFDWTKLRSPITLNRFQLNKEAFIADRWRFVHL